MPGPRGPCGDALLAGSIHVVPLGSSGPSCSVIELKALGCCPLPPPRGRPNGVGSPVSSLMLGGTLQEERVVGAKRAACVSCQ